MNNECIKQLISAILLQAVKDYCSAKATEKTRKKIIKELYSTRMRFYTNDKSCIVAEQLLLHYNEIATRLHKYKEEIL